MNIQLIPFANSMPFNPSKIDLSRLPDYFVVLVSPVRRSLDVRSKSLVGLYDLGVNRQRLKRFRHNLVECGVASGNSQALQSTD
tara:strand:- start:300 stop:551 length:252 start_codon:yes stop_codon:yes gene_type:complete